MLNDYPFSTHAVISVVTCPPVGCWSERTEVHKAASLGQASQLQHLIRGGASVNVVAVDSITPLHEACIRGQAQCVRLLLDAGAQVSQGDRCPSAISCGTFVDHSTVELRTMMLWLYSSKHRTKKRRRREFEELPYM